MFESEASAGELDFFGLSAEDYADDELLFAVWPQNWQSVQRFIELSGQWRVSMAGAYALDYAAVGAAFEMWGIKQKQRKGLFADIRLMEAEALRVMKEKADERK